MKEHKTAKLYQRFFGNVFWFLGLYSIRIAFRCIGIKDTRKLRGDIKREFMNQWQLKCGCVGCIKNLRKKEINR